MKLLSISRQNSSTIISVLGIVFMRDRYNGLSFLLVGKRLFNVGLPLAAISNAYERVRLHLPCFWLVGLRSCDGPHYGQVYGGFKAITWCMADLRRSEKHWDMASDGPCRASRISLVTFLRSPGRWRYDD